MLQPTKNKKWIDVIKSGLVGALTFTGIIFIWAIASIFSGSHRPAIVTTFMDSPKSDFAKEALIVIVGIGFILGVLLRRRFPIMQRRFFLLVIPLIMLVVPLGFGIWFLHEMWMGTELPPVNLKLIDYTNNVASFHLKAPKGHGYQFELFTPAALTKTNGSAISSYKFSGHIRISSGASLIADLAIAPDKVEHVESGFILTGVDSKNAIIPLGQFIQPQKDYDVQITLDPPPPPSTSLWLYCPQSVRDKTP